MEYSTLYGTFCMYTVLYTIQLSTMKYSFATLGAFQCSFQHQDPYQKLE